MRVRTPMLEKLEGKVYPIRTKLYAIHHCNASRNLSRVTTHHSLRMSHPDLFIPPIVVVIVNSISIACNSNDMLSNQPLSPYSKYWIILMCPTHSQQTTNLSLLRFYSPYTNLQYLNIKLDLIYTFLICGTVKH